MSGYITKREENTGLWRRIGMEPINVGCETKWDEMDGSCPEEG